jgi:hypothetical protein
MIVCHFKYFNHILIQIFHIILHPIFAPNIFYVLTPFLFSLFSCLFQEKQIKFLMSKRSILTFNRLCRMTVDLLRELEIRYSAISSMIDDSWLYYRLSPSIASMVPFHQVFDLNDLKENLVEVGLNSHTADELIQSFINVNRVSLNKQIYSGCRLMGSRIMGSIG